MEFSKTLTVRRWLGKTEVVFRTHPPSGAHVLTPRQKRLDSLEQFLLEKCKVVNVALTNEGISVTWVLR